MFVLVFVMVERIVTDEFIKEVQYKINRRPREKLNFSTPKKEFFLAIS